MQAMVIAGITMWKFTEDMNPWILYEANFLACGDVTEMYRAKFFLLSSPWGIGQREHLQEQSSSHFHAKILTTLAHLVRMRIISMLVKCHVAHPCSCGA